MDHLVGLLSDCAHGEGLLFYSSYALVALGRTFEDWSDAGIVAIGARFDQGKRKVKAHFVDVVPCVHVVQRINHDPKSCEKPWAKVVLLNFALMRCNINVWILLQNCCFQASGLSKPDVLSAKQKLAV